jgi:transposase
VVGVDIAQQTQVARAVNYRGIVIGVPLPFENNEDGFARSRFPKIFYDIC